MNFKQWLIEGGDLNGFFRDDQPHGKVSYYRPPKKPYWKSRLSKKIDKLFKGKSEAVDLANRGAGCIFTDGESILLLKRSKNTSNPGTWGCAGGHAEEGETPLQTAHRETKEEVGVNLNSLNYKKLGQSNEKNNRWIFFIYQVPKQFRCKLSDEHTAYKWIPIKELAKHNLHPLFKKNLPKYLSIINND